MNRQKKSKGFILCLVLLLAIPFAAFSQNAQEIDHLLSLNEVNYGQAAWLLLNTADVPGITEPSQAFDYVRERNWLPANAGRDDNARLDNVSLLIMKVWQLNGGIMYWLTQSPRYAYRELIYLDIIQGRVNPHMIVSGQMLLFLANRLLEVYGGEE